MTLFRIEHNYFRNLDVFYLKMDNLWKTITKFPLDNNLSSEEFWSGVCVYIDRPHLLNSKIIAAEQKEIWTDIDIDAELQNLLLQDDYSCENISNYIEKNSNSLNNKKDTCGNESVVSCSASNYYKIIIRNLVSKIPSIRDVLEAVILNYSEPSAMFFPRKNDLSKSLLAPSFPYKFKLVDKGIAFQLLENFQNEIESTQIESRKWLADKVLPKIGKWCINIPNSPIIPSLSLVSIKEYKHNLQNLKKKYAKKFLDIWPNYCNMEPTRYVHQSIALAAYLITLWNKERKELSLNKKQTFVDLGCGNGFLPFILSSEGHEGIGVDLRKRKLWEAYGSSTKLIEMAIEPNDNQLFPDHDWIIGNHSDELTPWIPIIAARSSYKMRMFLLPCCFFTFNGKYARSHHDMTQYQSYLQFLQQLCTAVGFNVQLDRLRITSTKRTCLVAMSRTYAESEENIINLKRTEFIVSHSKKLDDSKDSENRATDKEISQINTEFSSTGNWINDFKPRDSTECVRNCTKIDKNVVNEIVSAIFEKLLKDVCHIKLKKNQDEPICWNRGGKILIKDLCDFLNTNQLQCLKNQRGGIQTLVRNHGEVFEIKSGYIQLRVPFVKLKEEQTSKTAKKRKIVLRKRKCFFYFNHPQKCPLLEEHCTFSHNENDNVIDQ